MRLLLAFGMTAIGVMHFVRPEPFVQIVPPALPAPLALVYISGFFEILGGIGLLVPRVRKAASYGLVALYVAVFPANVYMAVADVALDGVHYPAWLRYGRLPLQLGLIAWALWVGRDITAVEAPRAARA